jgi:hypothetical protein
MSASQSIEECVMDSALDVAGHLEGYFSYSMRETGRIDIYPDYRNLLVILEQRIACLRNRKIEGCLTAMYCRTESSDRAAAFVHLLSKDPFKVRSQQVSEKTWSWTYSTSKMNYEVWVLEQFFFWPEDKDYEKLKNLVGRVFFKCE